LLPAERRRALPKRLGFDAHVAQQRQEQVAQLRVVDRVMRDALTMLETTAGHEDRQVVSVVGVGVEGSGACPSPCGPRNSGQESAAETEHVANTKMKGTNRSTIFDVLSLRLLIGIL
jgi:hypothetical protein